MLRLWAIVRKEFRHIFRDWRLLFLVTLSPAVMLVAFAYLFSFDTATVAVAVLDRDQSPQSRALLQALATAPELTFTPPAERYEALEARMQAGEIGLALVIPPGFGRDLAAGHRAALQLLSDGADPLSSSRQLVEVADRIIAWAAAYTGRSTAAGIEVRSLVLFNPFLASSHSMAPALLAIVLILPGMAVALAMTRETELGSFESLAATPIRPLEYVLGKFIPYTLFGLIGAGVAVLVTLLWFRVPFRGSYPDLILLILVYLAAVLGLSILFSSFMTTQSTALRAVLLLFLVPSIFLSGLLLPPDANAGLISQALPATHFVIMARGAFLKGQGVMALGEEVFILLSMAATALTLTTLLFRKQVR